MGRRSWAEDAPRESEWATVEYETGSIRLSRHGQSWEWYRTMGTMGPVWAEEMASAAWRGGRQWRRHRHWHRHHRGPWLPLAIFFTIFALTHGAILGPLFMMAIAFIVVSAVVRTVIRQVMAESGRMRGELPRPPQRVFATSRNESPILGPNEYRQRLLDVLKDRYVRGEITVAEFEERARQIVREPSARHLG